MSTYPLRVQAQPEPRAGRWLWLVKWLLLLPHWLILAALWVAFFVLSVAALVAILITGRYPRVIFDFNLGVLRWTWRVIYYGYGALGTDNYPPFTLRDVPDYPARLDVDYPERLSRGLVLVKWWLLAIPHYLVLAFILGGGLYVVGAATDYQEPWIWRGGLIGVLVLIAGVILLVTGRYPRALYDLVIGLNRWALRVAAYAGLMTDRYPPFRLDLGGESDDDRVPGGDREQPPVQDRSVHDRSDQDRSPEIASASAPASGHARVGWTAGRVVALVLGSLLLVGSAGIGAGGASLAIAEATMRNPAGFVMSPARQLTTETYAIRSPNLRWHLDSSTTELPQQLVGEVQVTVTSQTDTPVFVGVAPTADVEAFLRGVGQATVVDVPPPPAKPVYRTVPGLAPTNPLATDIWVAQSNGAGTQTVVVPFRDGDWSVVVLRTDLQPGVAVDLAVGALVPELGWLVPLLLAVAGAGLAIGTVMVIVAVRAARDRHDSEPTAPVLVDSR